MIDKKLEQLKMLKTVGLTPEEKGSLRASVARGIQVFEAAPRPSIFYTSMQHGLRIALSTFLFIVFVGGSVSVVADNSLPGDPLYSFKINVNEEVKGAFLKTPESKLSWEKTRIDNRLNEIKTLAASKTLTKAKQETAQRALDTHLQALTDQLSTAEPTEALKVTAGLEESLKIQKEDLKKYISDATEEDQNDALKAVDSTIKTVTDQEIKIISKEIDLLSTDAENVVDETIEEPEAVPTPLPVIQ
ncbi:MAG: hypothetical protein AAB681_03245 [Patescibacteria group bacterium]